MNVDVLKNQILETNQLWILLSLISAAVAIFVHVFGQTAGFTSSYWAEPNFYHIWPSPECPRFDQITHPLSSFAIAMLLLNLNLPYKFHFKTGVVFLIAVGFMVIWEVSEYVLAPLFGWVIIDMIDTRYDFWNNCLVIGWAFYGYHRIVREGVD